MASNSSTPHDNMTIKVSFEDDIRRFTLAAESLNYKTLHLKATAVFGLPAAARLLWQDPDGDKITLGGETDVQEALSVLRGAEQSVFRLEIMPASEVATTKGCEDAPAHDDTPPHLTRKAEFFSSVLECDVDTAKELLLKAKDGDSESLLKLKAAKATHFIQKKLQWVADALGTDIDEARAVVHKAVDGDTDAIVALHKLKEQKKGWHGFMHCGKGWGCGKGSPDSDPEKHDEPEWKRWMHWGMGFADGKGCGKGKGKGCGKGEGKGKGGKGEGKGGKGPRPLVRALKLLSGMQRSEARETIDAALAGDQTAQAKIGVFLDSSSSSSGSSTDTSKGSSSDSDSADEGDRQRIMTKLLRMLAAGDLEGLAEAKQQLAERYGHHEHHGHRHHGHHGKHHKHHKHGRGF